jgi:hypothetical protein
MDLCIEGHIFTQLQSQGGCRVPWIFNNLSVCTSDELFKTADSIVQDSLANLDTICDKPCRFLTINIGARNFEYDANSGIHQSNIYSPYKATLK